jgi:hypothetical protein
MLTILSNNVESPHPTKDDIVMGSGWLATTGSLAIASPLESLLQQCAMASVADTESVCTQLANTGQSELVGSFLASLQEVLVRRRYLERGAIVGESKMDTVLSPAMQSSLVLSYVVSGRLEHALGALRTLPASIQCDMTMLGRIVLEYGRAGQGNKIAGTIASTLSRNHQKPAVIQSAITGEIARAAFVASCATNGDGRACEGLLWGGRQGHEVMVTLSEGQCAEKHFGQAKALSPSESLSPLFESLRVLPCHRIVAIANAMLDSPIPHQRPSVDQLIAVMRALAMRYRCDLALLLYHNAAAITDDVAALQSVFEAAADTCRDLPSLHSLLQHARSDVFVTPDIVASAWCYCCYEGVHLPEVFIFVLRHSGAIRLAGGSGRLDVVNFVCSHRFVGK